MSGTPRNRKPRHRRRMNLYARDMGPLYYQAPKAVLAAILMGILAAGRPIPECRREVRARILKEWRYLKRIGVIDVGPPPQEDDR